MDSPRKDIRCFICARAASPYFRSPDRLYEGRKGEFDLWRCPACGLVFLSPHPGERVLHAHYPREYGPHADFADSGAHGETTGRIRNVMSRGARRYWFGYPPGKRWWQVIFYPYALRLAHYPYYRDNGSLLDIGCGSGQFMSSMKRVGWTEVVGIDFSERAVGVAKKRGLDAHVGTVGELRFPDSHFDAITMHHVFEHLPDPKEMLSEAKRILKDDGEVIITVPNTGSFLARLFGKNWFGFEIPRHLYNYNKKNLLTLLSQCGFRVTSVVSVKIFSTLMADIGYAFPKFRAAGAKTLRQLNAISNAAEFFIDPLLRPFTLGDELTFRARKR
ncbi:MAG: class I SAM-dependent methyltransferase [Candidatus Liptonbacteria bacterium]|nr:class I SAM-dependent methyltransferase [Candidatus Liptonbacteria bacterium]